MAKLTKKQMELLAAIGKGEVTNISEANAKPLMAGDAPFIEVNTAILNDKNEAAVRLTDAGKALISGDSQVSPVAVAPSQFSIIEGAEVPESKRGNRGGGAPTKYPFDQLAIGQSFFVPVSEDQPDPVKALGSTVSSANRRFSEKTGEQKQVMRTKRTDGNKAVRDANGKPVREQVTVDVTKPLRKFVIRKVESGKAYGKFTAPADGALISRTL